MKKGLLFVICIMCLTVVAFSQTTEEDVFYFNFIDGKLDESSLNENYLPNHPFGIEVARKLELLKEAYTWREEGSATMPVDRTIVEKPAIYNSIKKLSSHYKKQVKKGHMSEDEAKAELITAIDVALFIRYQTTNEFESKLREIKDAQEIATLFTKKVKIQY